MKRARDVFCFVLVCVFFPFTLIMRTYNYVEYWYAPLHHCSIQRRRKGTREAWRACMQFFLVLVRVFFILYFNNVYLQLCRVLVRPTPPL